jgi:hypothetical protein
MVQYATHGTIELDKDSSKSQVNTVTRMITYDTSNHQYAVDNPESKGVSFTAGSVAPSFIDSIVIDTGMGGTSSVEDSRILLNQTLDKSILGSGSTKLVRRSGCQPFKLDKITPNTFEQASKHLVGRWGCINTINDANHSEPCYGANIIQIDITQDFAGTLLIKNKAIPTLMYSHPDTFDLDRQRLQTAHRDRDAKWVYVHDDSVGMNCIKFRRYIRASPDRDYTFWERVVYGEHQEKDTHLTPSTAKKEINQRLRDDCIRLDVKIYNKFVQMAEMGNGLEKRVGSQQCNLVASKDQHVQTAMQSQDVQKNGYSRIELSFKFKPRTTSALLNFSRMQEIFDEVSKKLNCIMRSTPIKDQWTRIVSPIKTVNVVFDPTSGMWSAVDTFNSMTGKLHGVSTRRYMTNARNVETMLRYCAYYTTGETVSMLVKHYNMKTPMGHVIDLYTQVTQNNICLEGHMYERGGLIKQLLHTVHDMCNESDWSTLTGNYNCSREGADTTNRRGVDPIFDMSRDKHTINALVEANPELRPASNILTTNSDHVLRVCLWGLDSISTDEPRGGMMDRIVCVLRLAVKISKQSSSDPHPVISLLEECDTVYRPVVFVKHRSTNVRSMSDTPVIPHTHPVPVDDVRRTPADNGLVSVNGIESDIRYKSTPSEGRVRKQRGVTINDRINLTPNARLTNEMVSRVTGEQIEMEEINSDVIDAFTLNNGIERKRLARYTDINEDVLGRIDVCVIGKIVRNGVMCIITREFGEFSVKVSSTYSQLQLQGVTTFPFSVRLNNKPNHLWIDKVPTRGHPLSIKSLEVNQEYDVKAYTKFGKCGWGLLLHLQPGSPTVYSLGKCTDNGLTRALDFIHSTAGSDVNVEFRFIVNKNTQRALHVTSTVIIGSSSYCIGDNTVPSDGPSPKRQKC